MAENVQEVVKNMTVAEFRAYNPNGYDSMLKGITVQELQAANPDLIASIIEANKVTEMQFTVGGKEETIKVTELQGKFDAYEQKIIELENEKVMAKLDAYKVKKITEMVDEAHVETFMKRVSGNTEAEIDASINSEIEFVREMGGMNNNPAPRNNQKLGDDDMKSAVRNMFGVKESK